MPSNNVNSNNFLLGVNPQKKNISPSESLIDHLRRLEKESNNIVNENRNKNKPITNKSFNVVVNELIDKLEKDIYTLNNQIKEFNQEKKQIIDLNTKEIDRLKDIIRNLYMLVITVSKSIELGKSERVDLLQTLRKTFEDNKGLLKNIDEIMTKNYKKSNILNTESAHKENLKILNIVANSSPQNVSKLNTFYNGLKNEGVNKESEKVINNQPRNQESERVINNQPRNQESERVEEVHNNSKYKKIAEKINATKINSENAKKNLNKYFL